MNFKALILILCLAIPSFAYCQKEKTRVSVGVAVGKYGKFDKNWRSNEANYPALIMQFERSWKHGISLGGYVGLTGQHTKNLHSTQEARFTHYRVGTLATYDLNHLFKEFDMYPPKGVELYVSTKLGFVLEHEKFEDYSKNFSNTDNRLFLDFGVSIGGRYNLSNDFALYTELGWGNAGFLTGGISWIL